MHTLYYAGEANSKTHPGSHSSHAKLQQQSDKAQCYHQEQRAHHHSSTANNFRTLAAGDRWVVRIAVVRCSIVTHYIGKFISWCGKKLLKWNNSHKRIIFAKMTSYGLHCFFGVSAHYSFFWATLLNSGCISFEVFKLSWLFTACGAFIFAEIQYTSETVIVVALLWSSPRFHRFTSVCISTVTTHV